MGLILLQKKKRTYEIPKKVVKNPFDQLCKNAIQFLKWYLYKWNPKKCDHSFGAIQKAYRGRYCKCCDKMIEFVNRSGDLEKIC